MNRNGSVLVTPVLSLTVMFSACSDQSSPLTPTSGLGSITQQGSQSDVHQVLQPFDRRRRRSTTSPRPSTLDIWILQMGYALPVQPGPWVSTQ